MADQPLAPQFAKTLLIDVDVDGILGVEDVVERDRITPASLARLMTGPKAVGFCALTTIAS